MEPTKTGKPEPDVRERAIDAMQAVLDRRLLLSSPPRHNVAEALDVALKVYDDDHDAAVKDMMDRSLLAGMDIGPEGMTVKAIAAREVAVNMAMAAKQFLDEHPGAKNYVQQDVWDAEMANRYTVIFMKPGGQTPHDLRMKAEKRAEELAEELERLDGIAEELNNIRALRADPRLLRWCDFPGCWRAYDATTGPVGEPGWMRHRSPMVLLCPTHDQAGHRPAMSWEPGDDFVGASCQCGETVEQLRPSNHEAVITWWSRHVREVAA